MDITRNENRETAEAWIREQLEELRPLVEAQAGCLPSEELASLGAWSLRLPSSGMRLVDALLSESCGFGSHHSPQGVAKNLLTPDALERLLAGETSALAREFAAYLCTENLPLYRVFFPCDALDLRGFECFIEPLSRSELREMSAEEMGTFRSIRLGEPAAHWQFVSEVRAGDSDAAVRLARVAISRGLAPYYVHRALEPDPFWRVHVERRILSPRALFLRLNGDSLSAGISWNLEGARGRAQDLLRPSPTIDEAWHRTIYSYIGAVERGDNLSPIDAPLALCAYWVWKAEWDNDTESAFVKYNVAWEALFPCAEVNDRALSACLLLACIGSSDARCIQTVGQALRLRDRRHSFAHPRIDADRLWLTAPRNLITLRQSLRRALDAMMRLRATAASYPDTWAWSAVLSESRNALLAEDVRPADDKIRVALMELGLLDRDGKLSSAGQRARAELLLLDSLKRMKDPENAVRFAVRALLIARASGIRETHPYAVRAALQWLHNIGERSFERIWNGIAGSGSCPRRTDLEAEADAIHRANGLTFALLGWSSRDLPTAANGVAVE